MSARQHLRSPADSTNRLPVARRRPAVSRSKGAPASPVLQRRRTFNFIFSSICLLFALLSGSVAEANSYRALTTSEMIDRADLIVVGIVERSNGRRHFVRVEQRLRGLCPDSFWFVDSTDYQPRWTHGSILLLRKTGDDFGMFHPSCVQPMYTLSAIRSLLLMRQDPAPFIDPIKHPPDVDIVNTLGVLFSGYIASSGPYGWLAPGGRGDAPWKLIPWSDKSVVKIEGTIDSQGRSIPKVVSAQSGSLLAQYLRMHLEFSANPINGVTQPYWVSVDARTPERVGSLTATAALAYLRAQLDSENPQIVVEAIKALAKMRDLDSMDRVRALKHSKSPFPVAHWAEEFISAATRHDNGLKH